MSCWSLGSHLLGWFCCRQDSPSVLRWIHPPSKRKQQSCPPRPQLRSTGVRADRGTGGPGILGGSIDVGPGVERGYLEWGRFSTPPPSPGGGEPPPFDVPSLYPVPMSMDPPKDSQASRLSIRPPDSRCLDLRMRWTGWHPLVVWKCNPKTKSENEKNPKSGKTKFKIKIFFASALIFFGVCWFEGKKRKFWKKSWVFFTFLHLLWAGKLR